MKYLSLSICLFFSCICNSQENAEDIPPYLVGKVDYPVFKNHPYVGVIKTDNTQLKFNTNTEYKVVIDVYDKVKDSTQLLPPLREVARIFNLCVANGATKEKVKVTAVIHGDAINAILKDEIYNKKYKVDNPNLSFIHDLKNNGIEFYVCGQNLGLTNTAQENISADVGVAISAKTTFILLDQKGYTYMNVNED
ncbi:DsrE family protein [Aegicerativicinus sediminis]